MKISVRIKEDHWLDYSCDGDLRLDDVPEYVVERMRDDGIDTKDIVEIIANED